MILHPTPKVKKPARKAKPKPQQWDEPIGMFERVLKLAQKTQAEAAKRQALVNAIHTGDRYFIASAKAEQHRRTSEHFLTRALEIAKCLNPL